VTLVSQPVLALTPPGAVEIGPIAALVRDDDGGSVVYVNGLATFCFDVGDEVGRRLAAVQLVETEIARPSQVASGFGVTRDTLWRWRSGFAADGVAGLVPGQRGPAGPFKLTDEVVTRIRELAERGASLAAIGAETGVSTATVRVALGRRRGSIGWEARNGAAKSQIEGGAESACAASGVAGEVESAAAANQFADDADEHKTASMLTVLADPVARAGERALARYGLLSEAEPVFTQGARLPLAGLWLVLPAVAVTGLLEVFTGTYGRLRNGFYGLRPVVLTLLFLALLRDPRAEGLTRVTPADLGRLLGLDRAPEVKTLRRKLGELAAYRRGAALQCALASAHAAARPDAIGYLMIDGHMRAYFGTRDLQKTHVARLHMAARATAETWVADADGQPVMVITAAPSKSLAGEIEQLLPQLRATVGAHRSATLIFDRGGWSPALLKKIVDAEFDLICWRKGDFEPLGDTDFAEQHFTDADTGIEHTYTLAETTTELDCGKHDALTLRQIHKRGRDGCQHPLVTSRRDLPAAEIVWRLAGRWRQENYFRYGRTHFALDALDDYTDKPDDPTRLVPNPAKTHAAAAVSAAEHRLTDAETALADAISAAAAAAGQPDNYGSATVDPAAVAAVEAARTRLDQSCTDRADTPARVPLATIRPNARLLDEETKLITHAIRMSAYNAETALTRLLREHYPRATDEARALLREAMRLPGDIHITGHTLHLRLDPATAARRSRAIAGLCHELTATQTRYPGTDLKIKYSVKGHDTA
jgi:transposase